MIEAKGFPTTYGRDLTATLVAGLDRWIAVVHDEPWAIVVSQVDHPPVQVVRAGELSPEHLDRVVTGVRELGQLDAVIGIGGGTAMDTAKWVAWTLHIPLFQVPSLPSVNACFTRMVAVRTDGGVRYHGDAVPERVLVDFDLMAAAPPALVRGGIGDVLSCHTARFDWHLGNSVGRDAPWDDEHADMSLTYLDELEALAPLLAEADDDGVRRLMECHRDIGWRCHEIGHARFEEGSEHFLAYAFEEVTGRTIMHGELVTLGVFVMSAIQRNDPARPRRIAELARMRTGLDELGIAWEEMEAALRRLPSFVEEQALWWSAANDLVVDDAIIGLARAALRAG